MCGYVDLLLMWYSILFAAEDGVNRWFDAGRDMCGLKMRCGMGSNTDARLPAFTGRQSKG